jgi:phage terminase large subunit-like protein
VRISKRKSKRRIDAAVAATMAIARAMHYASQGSAPFVEVVR